MLTAAQARSGFQFQLVSAILLGTVCVAFLVEMAGRFAAVSRHRLCDGIRERFGFNFFLWPLIATLLVNLLCSRPRSAALRSPSNSPPG
jgi:Mn2+/Fe2+ NRAMP family transporter